MAISLFAGMDCRHRHVRCENDMGEELYRLLVSARDLYIKEVVNNKRMTAEKFAVLFCKSHRHIDCGRARCRNAHKANMLIVWHVLSAGEDFLKKYLLADVFTVGLCEEMVNLLLSCDAPPPPTAKRSDIQGEALSFGCSLTDEQLVRVTAIANAYRLFCVSEVSVDDMRSLFGSKEGFRIKARNVALVAVLFDTLYENGHIRRGWQKTLAEGGFVLSGKSGNSISASYLSTILSKKRRTYCPISERIRDAVKELTENG